jgi:hypothetical protein
VASRELFSLVESDLLIKEKLSKLTLEIKRSEWDEDHYERRLQQRAISVPMIEIALTYGWKKRIRGANTFTLTDRTIKDSPYIKYMDELRGLRVVTYIEGNTINIQTCYWEWAIKNRKRI